MSFLSMLSVNLASFISFLAQEKAAAPEAPPAPPPGGGAPGGGAGGSFGGGIILPLVLCFVVIYFIVMLPERRKQKARKAMITGVKKGDQVITTAGIIGKAVKVEEREVVIQVDKDNDVRMRFLKSAIHEVIPEGAEIKEGAAPPESR